MNRLRPRMIAVLFGWIGFSRMIRSFAVCSEEPIKVFVVVAGLLH